MAELEMMTFSVDIKLKNKHTSTERKAHFLNENFWYIQVYSSNVWWKKNLKTGNIYTANVEVRSIIAIVILSR